MVRLYNNVDHSLLPSAFNPFRLHKEKDKDKNKDKDKDPGDEVIDEPPVTVLPIVDYNLEQIELYTNTITDFGYSDDYTEEYARC